MKILMVAVIGLSVSSCRQEASAPVPVEARADAQVTSAAERPVGYVACQPPRQEICTREYRPVCAERDTDIRCVTTPCPSSERVTLPNACSACSDPKVAGYHPGHCSSEADPVGGARK